jgi:peptidyl-prolyl cis-trans isomerase D
MTPKFNDFAFGNRVEHIGLVETEFGYHIVRVDDKQDLVRIATLSRNIEPSEETINTLFTDATKFEMGVTSGEKSLTDLAKESDLAVRPVLKIKEMDENLPGLSAQRGIVQWAFAEDTDVGDIKRFNINNGYAVVQLTAKYKEGLMDVEDASATVLARIRKDKKAAQLLADNTGKDMSTMASSNNVSETAATALTVKTPTIPGAGREPLVVGTAFAMEQGEISGLIKGETGIFMVEVTNKEIAPVLDNYATYSSTLFSTRSASVNNRVYNALKKEADIEDNRSVFY